MASNQEVEKKILKIRGLLLKKGFDALVVQRATNFSWLTGGASSYINIADDFGVGALVITHDQQYLVTNNIKSPRFLDEENLDDQGWEFVVGNWYEAADLITNLLQKMKVCSDGFYPVQDLNAELIRLRMNLFPEEQERFQILSKDCAEVMKSAVDQIGPGQSEFEIAAILGAETQRRGILPTVILIATDDRIFSYRHPLPTDKTLDKYAMLVLCGRDKGLVCSITRLIHFGPMSEDLKRRAHAVAQVDATLIAATRPGVNINQIFSVCQQKYEEIGFADEWQKHHQGGPAGYLPREAVATLESDLVVEEGQVFAWNPSITGTKSEDTILVGPKENIILTEIDGWPVVDVEIDGKIISRPAIQEIV